MRDPNFSESQLQQAVNTAYIRKIFEIHGEWAFANVPSLFDEFDLGWDTAFHFPWLPYPPADDHEGCNFFLQYKLSGEFTSAGAKQWPFWCSEYFRFKIPHSTRDVHGAFVEDYHQWDRLKELADQNYPTFYATNSTLSKEELRNESDSGTLLNTIPLLDVRLVVDYHKLVTFTPDSTYFLLHSEQEEVKKIIFSDAIEQIVDSPAESIEKANKKLLGVLEGIRDKSESWQIDISKIRQLEDVIITEQLSPLIMRSMLISFIRKHIGAYLLWLPKNG